MVQKVSSWNIVLTFNIILMKLERLKRFMICRDQSRIQFKSFRDYTLLLTERLGTLHRYWLSLYGGKYSWRPRLTVLSGYWRWRRFSVLKTISHEILWSSVPTSWKLYVFCFRPSTVPISCQWWPNWTLPISTRWLGLNNLNKWCMND